MSEELKPKPNEVWVTKSSRDVLVVYDTSSNGNKIGFVWFDEIDHTLTFSSLLDQLSHKHPSMTIAEWGLITHELARPIDADEPPRWFLGNNGGVFEIESNIVYWHNKYKRIKQDCNDLDYVKSLREVTEEEARRIIDEMD